MKNILVLCTGNSARSILGEALLQKLGEGRIQSFSAGSHPKGMVHPASLSILDSKGYEVSSYRSKSWDEFADIDSAAMDIVITVCDSAGNETCPVWISNNGVQPISTHWGIADPADIEGEGQMAAFELAYQQMNERVERLVSTEFETMNKDALKRLLDEIGANCSGATAQAKGESYNG